MPRYIQPMIDMSADFVNMVNSGVAADLTARERQEMDTMLSREWGGRKVTNNHDGSQASLAKL